MSVGADSNWTKNASKIRKDGRSKVGSLLSNTGPGLNVVPCSSDIASQRRLKR